MGGLTPTATRPLRCPTRSAWPSCTCHDLARVSGRSCPCPSGAVSRRVAATMGLEQRLGGAQQFFPLARPFQSAPPRGGRLRISTRSVSSNSYSCSAPDSTSERTAGPRNALIQSSPAGLTSSRMRASVNIPRSPTSTTLENPKRRLSLSILRAHGGRVRGVAVEHLHRHRPALGVAQQPELDLQLAALAVARVAAPPQRARGVLPDHTEVRS